MCIEFMKILCFPYFPQDEVLFMWLIQSQGLIVDVFVI